MKLMARATRQTLKSRGAAISTPGGEPDSARDTLLPSAPPTPAADAPISTRARRYRGTRGGRRHRHPEKPQVAAVPEPEVELALEPASGETEAKSKRRHGSR